jgi:LPS-assembly protein
LYLYSRSILQTGLFLLWCTEAGSSLELYTPQNLEKEFSGIKEDPLVLSAQDVCYDDTKGLCEAHGNVLLQQGCRVLMTDHLLYSKEKDRIKLPSPFLLKDGNGEILKGASGYFCTALREGKIRKARLFSRRRESLATEELVKKGDILQCDISSYTPCEILKEGACPDTLDTKEPLWKVSARRIIKDDEKQTITFTDAHLEFLSVPILYAPHFYVPTKRTSGFLLPYASATQELGVYVGQPYYWVINSSGDNDLMMTPFLMTKGGVMLASEYRHRLNDGLFVLKGAANSTRAATYSAFPEPVHLSSVRGYFNSNIEYNFTSHWRLRSDEWWTSDRTFLSTRPFFGETTEAFLESRTTIEGLYTQHFVKVNGIRYQGLQNGDIKQTTPYLYPVTCYSYVTPNLWKGSYAMFNIETLSLYQQLGTQVQRGLVSGDWILPLETKSGQVVTPFAYVEGTFYRAKQQGTFALRPVGGPINTARLYPQGGLEWKWPLTFGGRPFFIITPLTQVIMGAFHVNKDQIPNEDSLGVAFTDSVLFERNRFPGHDRVDDGARANYALLAQMYLPNGQSAEIFFGQSYSFSTPPLLIHPDGVRKGPSDFVGRIETNFQKPQINLRYRFRFDQKKFSGRYHEVAAVVGPPSFSVSGGYISSTLRIPHFKPLLNPIYNQLFLTVSSQFAKHWTGKVFLTQNFKNKYQQQKILDKGIGIAYENECFVFNLTVQRSYYKMQDLVPGVSVDFSVHLKNLGGFHKKVDRFTRRTDLETSPP